LVKSNQSLGRVQTRRSPSCAATLLSGSKFAEAGVYGAVESDFFPWVIEIDEGETFIRTLAKRLMRFVWHDVDQDVLKFLYENFIGAETRKRLGEYYTPTGWPKSSYPRP